MQEGFQKYVYRIQQLCKKYQVHRLWVFGSVLTESFHSDSDIDFLYELDHRQLSGEKSIQFFLDFHEELGQLFQRPIELVWYPGIRNPYFKAEVDETKILIYDAQLEEILV
ncbi:MAG: nucleotidyltransferase domain-containing protein [Bacteroidota bacterium]